MSTTLGICGGKYVRWPSARRPTVKRETKTMTCIGEQGETRWLYGGGLLTLLLLKREVRSRPTAYLLPRRVGRKVVTMKRVHLVCCGVLAAGTARPLAGVSVRRKKMSRSVVVGNRQTDGYFLLELGSGIVYRDMYRSSLCAVFQSTEAYFQT